MEGGGDDGVVGGIDGAQVGDGGAGAHASDHGRLVGPQRAEMVARYGHSGRRDRGPGARTGAGDRLGVDDRRARRARRAGDDGGAVTEFSERRGGHAPEGNRVAVATQVREQRGLQCAEHEAARTQRPRQRMVGAPGHKVSAPRDHAGLGTSQQLVARERDEGGALAQRLAGRGLPDQPGRRSLAQPRAGRVQEARAEIDHDRHLRQGRTHCGHRGRLGEALDSVVRGMNFQDARHVGVGGLGGAPVVVDPRPVRRADVDQSRPRLGGDLRHAEAAADLHALAPAHDDLAARRHRRQHEQHGGGAVVHHDGGLSPTSAPQEHADPVVAVAPLARRQIELEIAGGGRLSPRHRRPAEVRMQQDARCVHDRAQQSARQFCGARLSGAGIARCDGGAGGVDGERMRQPQRGQRPGESIDRWRAHSGR